MKTDLKALLQTTCKAIETLTADRAAAAADDLNTQQLLGHTISGLRGIETNVRGLLGEKPVPVGRVALRPPSPTAKNDSEGASVPAPKKPSGGASVPASLPKS
jgi:hypothetical protein